MNTAFVRGGVAGVLVAVMSLSAVAANDGTAPASDVVFNKHGDALAGPDVFGGYPTTHLLVRFQPGVEPDVFSDGAPTGEADLDAAFQRWGVTHATPFLVVPAQNKALAARLGLDRTWLIHVPQGTDTPRMMAELNRFPGLIEFAELDGIGGIAEVIPNDPDFSRLYGMHNTGQTGGTPDADIDAPEAWDLFTGEDNVTLAVIDSGVDGTHVELASKMVPGRNTNNNSDDTRDACPHGTHVAGTAGAIGNNGIGVAGVSWGVKIMPIRVLSGCGGTEAQCAAGIVWATDHGAHIGTMSLQYYTGADVFRDAVEYAYQSGVLLIAANGNGRGRLVAFPAKFEHCMGISATTDDDTLAGFSNYGPECDVSAPGDSVWSLENGGGYSFKSGTSMATPHTSGLASLMLSYNPGLSPDEIEQILKDTSDDKGAPGWDEQFGWGRINARQALEASGGDPSPAACCFGDGACEDQLRNDCVDNGGRWNFGKECGTFDCPLPGACCINNSECEVTLERDCTIQGGTFLGEGESCFRACPCDKVKKMKGNCKGSGTIKGIVKFRDNSYDGKTVKMGVGERLRFDVTVRGKKATLFTCCFNGEQSISLLDPEGCLEPIVVNCN